jgi:hypothetical protein
LQDTWDFELMKLPVVGRWLSEFANEGLVRAGLYKAFHDPAAVS